MANYSFFRFLRSLNKSSTAKSKAEVHHETLENILKDKLLTELFNDWAAQNLCSENLLFYSEVWSHIFIQRHISYVLLGGEIPKNQRSTPHESWGFSSILK